MGKTISDNENRETVALILDRAAVSYQIVGNKVALFANARPMSNAELAQFEIENNNLLEPISDPTVTDLKTDHKLHPRQVATAAVNSHFLLSKHTIEREGLWEKVFDKINDIRSYENDWDDNGAIAPIGELVDAATNYLLTIKGTNVNLVPSSVNPTADGWLRIEWRLGDTIVYDEVEQVDLVRRTIYNNLLKQTTEKSFAI